MIIMYVGITICLFALFVVIFDINIKFWELKSLKAEGDSGLFLRSMEKEQARQIIINENSKVKYYKFDIKIFKDVTRLISEESFDSNVQSIG